MTVTLNLKPELEADLVAHAQAAGLSVEAYLEKAVEERLSVPMAKRRLSAHEWARQFEESANSFPEAPPISDEALSRETLYPDRR